MTSATTRRNRAEVTRERLLDAAEALVADVGYAGPSHRDIAGRAGVHVALVNYHYGSKDLLLDEVIARRSGDLVAAWRSALASPAHWTAERVLRAYWAPFGSPQALADGPWRNYLCAVAWLSQAEGGDARWALPFGAVEGEFRQALALALPGVPADAIQRGFRYARELLDALLLRRCNRSGGTCAAAPVGLREGDVDALIEFLAAGLAATPPAAPAMPLCRIQRSTVAAD
jgi:AcrR family transcriptional regulator